MRTLAGFVAVTTALGCASTPSVVPAPAQGSQVRCSTLADDSLLAALRSKQDPHNPEVVLLQPGKAKYPRALRESGTEGWVKLAFVVQTDGTVDPCTVRVLEFSDQAFIEPSKKIVLGSTFAPLTRQAYGESTHRFRLSD